MKNLNLVLLLTTSIACLSSKDPTPDPPWFSKHSSFIERSKRESSKVSNPGVRQLEQIVKYVNGLILTEALAEGVVNVTTLTTDFLILSRLSETDVLTNLESLKLDVEQNAKLEKQYKQMSPLWQIIENGANVSNETSTDVIGGIREMVAVANGLETTNKIRANFESLKSLISQYQNRSSSLQLNFDSERLSILLELPQLMKRLLSVSDGQNYIDSVPEAIQLPIDAKKKNSANSFANALRYYNGYSNEKEEIGIKNSIKSVLQFLKEGIKTVIRKVDYSAAKYLADLMKLYSISASFNVLNHVENNLIVFSELKNEIEKLENFEFHVIDAKSAKSFSEMLNVVNSLKTFDFEALDSVLNALKPVSSISNDILKMHGSIGRVLSTPKSSFLKRFKSFSGFENGIDSYERMGDELFSTKKRPAQFSYSRVNDRSMIAKILVAKIHSYTQFASGLQLIESISSLSELLKVFVRSVPDGLENNTYSFDNFAQVKKSLATLKNVTDILTDFIDGAQSSISHHWKTGLTELYDAFPESSRSKILLKLLSPLPPFIKFANDLNEALGPHLMETDAKDWKEEHFMEVFAKMGNINETINLGIKLSEAVEKAAVEDGTNVLVSFQSNEDDLSRLREVKNSTLFVEWVDTNFHYSFEEVFHTRIDIQNINELLEKLTKGSKVVEDSVAKFEPFVSLQSIENVTFDKTIVEASINLLQAITNATHDESQFVGDPSEGMAKLMKGSPFGADILTKLRNGLHGFQSLFAGIESIQDLKKKVSTLSSNHSYLVRRTMVLLNGAEALEVFSTMKVIDRIQLAEEWIGGLNKTEQEGISRELAILKKKNDSKSEPIIELLHSFVSQLNSSTAKKIGDMKQGLEMFVDALSFVNCTQVPSHVSCQTVETKSLDKPLARYQTKGTNSGTNATVEDYSILYRILLAVLVVILVVILVLGLIVGVVWYRREKERKKIEREDKLAAKRRAYVVDMLMNSPDDHSTVKLCNYSLLVEEFMTHYPDMLGLVWATQLARCLEPENKVLIWRDEETGSFAPVVEKNLVWAYNSIVDRPLPHYNANEMIVTPDRRICVAQSPRRSTSNLVDFFNLLYMNKVDVVIQVGSSKEAGFEEDTYIKNVSNEEYTMKWKWCEDSCCFVLSKIVNVTIRRSNTHIEFCHIQYVEWPADDCPAFSEAATMLVSATKRCPSTYEMVEKIVDNKKVVERERKKFVSYLVQSENGNGRALIVGAALYVNYLAEQQLLLRKKKLEINKMTDPRIIEGFNLRDLVEWLRTIRYQAFQSVHLYACFEMMVAHTCVEVLDEPNSSSIETYNSLQSLFEMAQLAGFVKLDWMIRDEAMKKELRKGRNTLKVENENEKEDKVKSGSKNSDTAKSGSKNSDTAKSGSKNSDTAKSGSKSMEKVEKKSGEIAKKSGSKSMEKVEKKSGESVKKPGTKSMEKVEKKSGEIAKKSGTKSMEKVEKKSGENTKKSGSKSIEAGDEKSAESVQNADVNKKKTKDKKDKKDVKKKK